MGGREEVGEVGTLVDRACTPLFANAIGHLSVGQLGWRQPGRDGLAGDGQRRVEVAGHQGRQGAEQGAELIRRSLLWGNNDPVLCG